RLTARGGSVASPQQVRRCHVSASHRPSRGPNWQALTEPAPCTGVRYATTTSSGFPLMCVTTASSRPDGATSAGRMSRRLFLVSMPAFLAACSTTGEGLQSLAPTGPHPYYVAMYGPIPDET